jgi:hypothetical protein
LIEYFLTAWQGPGRKDRLRRKHRRDIDGIIPFLAFRKAQRGREEKNLMKSPNTPATAREGYVPHDCKQYDLPSGALESHDIWNRQAL